MTTTKRKKGETAQRIYKLLHRNPDLTSNEIGERLPDLSARAVQVTVSRMYSLGQIKSRAMKSEVCSTGRVVSHRAYHVAYKSMPKAATKPKKRKQKPLLLTVEAPAVEAPKPKPETVEGLIRAWAEEVKVPEAEAPKPVVDTQPVWNPAQAKPELEGPTTPTAEREVLVLRHLTDIYKSLNRMAEQQEALIEVLKGTLMDLAETKQELEEAQKARGFWGTLKGWFA